MARAPIGKHGRDHRPPKSLGPTDPGGHDPIDVKWLFPNGGYATYPAGVASISSLVGYWPLTDGATPYADVSGLSPADPAVLTATGTSPTMTQDYTPGPLAVNDQGAVAFNAAGGTAGEYLHVTDPTVPRRFNFDTGDWSFAVWIYPFADAGSFAGPIFSDRAVTTGVGGYHLYLDWATKNIHFQEADGGSPNTVMDLVGGAITTGKWWHIGGSVKFNNAGATTSTLYYQGAQVATATATLSGSSATLSLPTFNTGFDIGHGLTSGFSTFSGFKGGIAHLAFWNKALSGSDFNLLYLSGNVPAAGSTLTADGSGGWTSTAPRTFYLNGA